MELFIFIVCRLYMIRDNAGIEGFMGINGTMLEMLFVHPRAIGTGIGKH